MRMPGVDIAGVQGEEEAWDAEARSLLLRA